MKIPNSLHGKITLGYVLVGGVFVALLVNALFQFRALEVELGRQRAVVDFYDAVRDARRLEKNFLLYQKTADIVEAIERAKSAKVAFEHIPEPLRRDHGEAADADNVTQYPALLERLMATTGDGAPPGSLLREAFATGSALIHLGERLDNAVEKRVASAVQRHDADLQTAIWAALALAALAGILVTRSVVRPLREIEASLRKVAKGEVARLEGPEAEAEVASLTRSINDTLQEVTDRQTSQARSSRLMALGTMLSGVAHELNNPLSNISSSCQILEEEWQELPEPQVQKLLSQIDGQVLRAQHIVATLLDFSGSRSLQRRPEGLRELVEDSSRMLAGQISPGIALAIEVPAELRIDVDRRRFQQVLINMIKNAADATTDHGKVFISAWREDFPEGPGVTLEIADDGAGIPDDQLGHVFDPFYTTKAVGKGTGLGLFVAHEIISQHGGKLSVDSRLNEGTQFWIHIPDAPAGDTHG